MNIILQGTLSYERKISHILEKIRQRSVNGLNLLNLSSPDDSIEGSISIRDCRFITGAICLADGATGYVALKKLLSLLVGAYTVTEPGADELSNIDQDINIDLDRIIPFVPFLPENLSELFDQASLLDKVFSKAQEQSGEPPITVVEPDEPLAPLTIKDPATNKPLLQSLVASNRQRTIEANNGQRAEGSDKSDQVLENKSQFRQAKASLLSMTGLNIRQKWLLVSLIVISLIGLFLVSKAVVDILEYRTAPASHR